MPPGGVGTLAGMLGAPVPAPGGGGGTLPELDSIIFTSPLAGCGGGVSGILSVPAAVLPTGGTASPGLAEAGSGEGILPGCVWAVAKAAQKARQAVNTPSPAITYNRLIPFDLPSHVPRGTIPPSAQGARREKIERYPLAAAGL
jgi:hypothetical protein